MSAAQDEDAEDDAATLTHNVVDASRADEYDDVPDSTLGVTVTDDEAVTVLAEAPADGGVELAVKTDGLLLGISSDSARDSTGGRLAGAEADVSRLRLGLEGTWRGAETDEGGTLTPTFEVGVRHDGGDAETGFGVEAGGGLAWTDPASGIAAEIKARGLLAHEADGFRELGLSGSFGSDPTPGSDRGPSLTLTQTMASEPDNRIMRRSSRWPCQRELSAGEARP